MKHLTSSRIITINSEIKNKSIQLCFFICLLLTPLFLKAQKTKSSIPKDTLISAAREIIKGSPFCALATVDANGQPQIRTMNPFPLGDDLVIWFATSRNSRKVTEIKNNPKVSVYYADHNNPKGYVNITGKAVIIDNKELLIKKKRDYWQSIPDWQDKFVLIKIIPETLDVINYARGVNGDPETNRSPSVSF